MKTNDSLHWAGSSRLRLFHRDRPCGRSRSVGLPIGLTQPANGVVQRTGASLLRPLGTRVKACLFLLMLSFIFMRDPVAAAVIGDSETQFAKEYGAAVEKREPQAGISARTYQFKLNEKEFRIYVVFFSGICHIMGVEAAYGKPLEDATINSWLDAAAAQPKAASYAWKQMPPKPSEPSEVRTWVRGDPRHDVVSATYKKNAKGLWNLTFRTGKGMDWSVK